MSYQIKELAATAEVQSDGASNQGNTMRNSAVLIAMIVSLLPAAGAAGGAAVPLDAAGMLEEECREQFDVLARQIAERAALSPGASTAYHPAALIADADRDPADIVLRRTAALLADLKGSSAAADWAALESRLAELAARGASVSDRDARTALYRDVCALRRTIAFANPLLDFDKVLFVKRHRGKNAHMCDQYYGFFASPGGGICVLSDPFGPSPQVRDVLADSVVQSGRLAGRKLAGAGSFLSPSLSYDGKTIFFAYTEVVGWKNPEDRWSPGNTYHLFKVNVDGSALVQLTDGPWNEFDPIELPNGRVGFISERRGGYGRCHPRYVPLYTLHTMRADGGDIVCISPHEANEWHPAVDNNGMIVYTRWDYWDRGFNQAHHPWITAPDGLDARVIQGNYGKTNSARPDMEMNVRPIPRSAKYVATAAPHHGHAFGSFVVIDPSIEDDDAMAPLRRLTPDVPFPEVAEYPQFKGSRAAYGTAFALSERYYLCAYDPKGNKHGLYLLDCFGNKELLYRDASIPSISPIPLRPAPVPPVLPPTTVAEHQASTPGTEPPRAAESLAPVLLINVYNGQAPWPPETKIAALRIVQILPKTTPIHNEPRIGYGAEKGARAVLGTVPVEADGSAHFLMPTDKPVYFQALDEKGLAVQSMRSDTYVRPGQRLTCQGCHEPRHRTPAAPDVPPLASQRAASIIKPEVEGTNPFSFARLVQPVLEKNCLPCHTKNADKKPPNLVRGDFEKNPYQWYTSYISLEKYAFFFGARPNYSPRDNQYDAWTAPKTEPGKFGARASRLYLMLAAGHNDLKLTDEEWHRLALWLDANSDFFGAYENTLGQCRGEVVKASME